jgi:hypothetical protein
MGQEMDKPEWDVLEPELLDVVKRYSYRQQLPWIELDDIRQLMLLEMWRAYQAWDPSRGPLLPFWWVYWVRARQNMMQAHDRRKRQVTVLALDGGYELWEEDPVWVTVTDPDTPPCPIKEPLHEAVWQDLAAGWRIMDIVDLGGVRRSTWRKMKYQFQKALSG